MSISFWLLFAAALLTVFSKLPMNLFGIRQEPYDNHYPRLQHLRYEGIAHRAWAAHQNSIEAFPLFAVGLLVAHVAGVAESLIAVLGGGFLFCRLLYIGCYLVDRDRLRSVLWGLGFLCTLGLYLSPLLV